MQDINSRPTPIASDVPSTCTEGGVMRTKREGWREGWRDKGRGERKTEMILFCSEKGFYREHWCREE